MKTILKIALSGGIACGKSTVTAVLRKMGLAIIDLDYLAKIVVEPNTTGLNELSAYFGEAILRTDKTLNRQVLSELIFNNKAHKKVVEAILHPKILVELEQQIALLTEPVVIVVVPLLAEQNLSHLFTRAILITCTKNLQLKRLKNRDHISTTTANKIINSQVSTTTRQQKISKKLPIDIIENNGNLSDLEGKVKVLVKNLTKNK